MATPTVFLERPNAAAPAPTGRRWLSLLLAVLLGAAGMTAALPAPPAAAVLPPGSPPPVTNPIVPREPTRMLDTRTTNEPLGPGETRLLHVPFGTAMGPSGTQGYALNLTAVSPSQATHLTVAPYVVNGAPPNTSVMNLRPGETRATFTVTKTTRFSPDWRDWFVVRNNSGSVHLVIDVLGYVGPTAYANTDLAATIPTRIVDTRSGLGAPQAKLGPGQSLTVTATDHPTAQAALVNVTVVTPSAPTHLTAWRTGDALPATSSVNARAGEVTPNLVLTRLDAAKRFTIRNNSGTTDLVIDLVGLVTNNNGTRLGLLDTPARLLDTRTGAAVGPGGIRNVLATAAPGVPDDAYGVLVSLTLVSPSASTHLTAWRYGQPMPTASTVNGVAGQTVANATLVPVAELTKLFSVANNAGNAHVVVDVIGWLR